MKVGSLVMCTKGDNKALVGSLGIAIEEYYSDDLDEICFRIHWVNTNGVGCGWTATCWNLEVICE